MFKRIKEKLIKWFKEYCEVIEENHIILSDHDIYNIINEELAKSKQKEN